MKSIENAIDLGLGLIILVLVASTSYYGLQLYNSKDLRTELQDKNTVSTIIHAPVADDVAYERLEDMNMAILSAALNKDNVREIIIIIRGKNDPDDSIQFDCGTIQNLDDVNTYMTKAYAAYAASGGKYVANLAAGNWQLLTAERQGRIYCYILL